MRVHKDGFSSLGEIIFNNELLHNAVKSTSPQGIIQFILNKKNELIFSSFNSSCNSILGMNCEPLIGKTVHDIFPSLINSDVLNEWINIAISGDSWEATYNKDNTNSVNGTFQINIHQIGKGKIIVILKKIENRTIELAESELRFRRLVDNITDGIRIIENEKLIFVNKGFCDISGYTKAELQAMKGIELVNENDFHWVSKVIEQTKKSNKPPEELKFWINRKNGTKRFIHNRYSIWEKASGDFTLYIFTTDITEKERDKEQLLLQSSALNAAANGITITDRKGKIMWANDAFCNLTKFDRHEIIGNSHSLIKSGLHGDNFYKNLWNTIESGNVWRGEVQNKRKDGQLYHEEMTITPVKLNNEITNFVAIKHDISIRKNNELEIARREQKYRSLFENSHNAILVSDFKGNILEMNNAAKDLVGIINEKITELNSLQFIIDSSNFSDFLITLKRNGFIKDFAAQIKKRDGLIIDCLINATIHTSESGESDVFQAIIWDVTDAKLAKEILENALTEAEKANRLKSEFLATMSHEIRTPINIILSYLSLINTDIMDKVDEDLQGLFPSMENAGNRIIRTIDLLLNVAELNAGTYECKYKEINLIERVLENIYFNYKREAKSKGLEFHLLKQTDECIINGDEYTITEIFKNLVDNAIKYTSKGAVEIIVRKNLKNLTEVEIKDTGIGIEKSYLPELFEPFTQEESGYSRKYEGNGLGLALVKKYTKLNNAEIQIISKKGMGTSFVITFNL